MDKKLIEQLKSFKKYNGQFNPDHVWVAQTKERIMGQITNTACQEKKNDSVFGKMYQVTSVLFPKQMIRGVLKPALMFVLVIGVAMGGWSASVGATQNSLPGDMGWGVKLATEKISLAFTTSEEKGAKLNMEHASKRAQEVKEVVKKNDKDAVRNVASAVEKLEESIESAKDNLKKLGEDSSENIVEVVKGVKEKTKEIKNTLKDAEKENNDVDMADTKKKVSDTGLEAVELVIQKKTEGVVEVSDEEVRELVEDEIINSLEDSDDIKTKVEEVEEKLGKAEGRLKDDLVEGETEELGGASTSTTDDLVETIVEDGVSTTLKMDPKKAVEEANKKVDEVEETIKDLEGVKELIDNNQILEAIQKVKEVNEVNQQAEKVVKEANRVIDEINNDNDEKLKEELDLEPKEEVGEVG